MKKTNCKKHASVLSFACLSLTLVQVAAQNTSYRANTIPIVGSNCAAFGEHALFANTVNGLNNTATGYYALAININGSRNAAHGTQALVNNTSGNENTANGFQALFKNTTGGGNIASGYSALYFNKDGFWNTACGHGSLYNNLSGNDNTAIGHGAMEDNTSGGFNAACGTTALERNTTGMHNVAVGYKALVLNITGFNNTAVGSSASVSSGALSNATAIGADSRVNASNKIRLGSTSVTVVEGPVAYTVSDGRFKNNISESDVKGLEFIKRLRPVVYNFDTKKMEEFLSKNVPEDSRRKLEDSEFAASSAIRQSGFIAQEVEKAAQEAGYNFNGLHKPENDDDNYSLAYGQFVVPLVKAVQEQQIIIEKQQKQIDELKKLIDGISTSVNPESSSSTDLQIYPNPGNGIFNIRTKGIEAGVIEVITLEGKRIYKTEVLRNSTDYKVDLSGYAQGIYLVTINSNGKEIMSKKIIVE